MKNPLLASPELVAFDEIQPEHITPAMDVLLAQADAALERAVGPDVPPDFDALSAVFTVATERLARAWGAHCATARPGRARPRSPTPPAASPRC